MAARFVVVVALFAMCHSSPVLLNGEVTRDGRSISTGKSWSQGEGVNVAAANANNFAAQASSSNSNGATYYRNIYSGGYGQAGAEAQTIQDQPAQYVARTPYYQVPIDTPVVTYTQNLEAPAQIYYQPQTPAAAQSVAASNGVSDTSLSYVANTGAGLTESNAQTQGGAGTFGITATNAKTLGGGSAASKANTGFGTTSSNAQTHGHGFASSAAQNNGAGAIITPVATPVVAEEIVPAVIAAKNLGYRTVYTPPVYGASIRAPAARRSISWRFGTAYDNPAGYAKSTAASQGYSAANAKSNVYAGAADTIAQTQGNGYANADAINHPAYQPTYQPVYPATYIRSEPVLIGYGKAETNADTRGSGDASGNVNLNYAGQHIAKANARSQDQGAANAHSAYNHPGSYAPGIARSQGADWAIAGQSATNARTSGHGAADSYSKTNLWNPTQREINSKASSAGFGSAAHADSVTV